VAIARIPGAAAAESGSGSGWTMKRELEVWTCRTSQVRSWVVRTIEGSGAEEEVVVEVEVPADLIWSLFALRMC
jgi:hypothetical protein